MVKLFSQVLGEVADRAPHSVAFRSPDQAITYGEMEIKTNKLANFLIEQGIKRGDRVGVMLPRNLGSAISVYGIFKAGAAFVPIDPQSPVTRVCQIVSDCNIQLLISDSSLRPTIQGMCRQTQPVECIVGIGDIDTNARLFSWTQIDTYPDHVPVVATHEDDLAYIMYTSGSTGAPKGIMHTHASGLAYAELSARTYQVQPVDCIGNHSPLHFDISTMGYFTAPFVGASTLIVPGAHTKFPSSLSQLMETSAITIWYSVPHALIQLLLHGVLEKRNLESLRWIIFGGESFPPKYLRALMKQWPHARFSNSYGPAEVNQCSFFHVPPKWADDNQPAPISIGKIWHQAKGKIVRDQIEVERGEAAELVVNTPTMMQGYWNRPDLNKSAFVEFEEGDGRTTTYYKTGDSVREADDGNLYLLGRNDRQIKLRGFRIELDEVELNLSAHSEIEEVGVYPIEKKGETIELEATILLNSHERFLREYNGDIASSPLATDITKFIKKRLPSYAVPSRLVFAASLPRTSSGKINRLALQETAQRKLEAEND